MKRSMLAVVGLLLALVTSCYRDSVSSPEESGEQVIVDRATNAIEHMRQSGQFPGLDALLEHAQGVMIFPRVVKAAFVFGGEGGNGVLLARDPQGNWTPPAFYGLGAGSAGFQLGYQEATIVLVFMNRAALMSAIDRGLTLGADASVAAGTMGRSGAATATNVASDIYQLVEVGGVFAGVSLDGTVVRARTGLNESYYGPGATARGIVIDQRFANPAADGLRAALMRSGQTRKR